MPDRINFKPQGYHTVTPYLIITDVGRLINFLQQVFDGEVVERLQLPGGRIMHAEVRIGDSRVMLGEAAGPEGVVSGMLHLYLEDVDATYRQALAAGATSLREPTNEFYGDRSAGVKDAFGNQWWLATHIEDVPPEEIQRRAAAQASAES